MGVCVHGAGKNVSREVVETVQEKHTGRASLGGAFRLIRKHRRGCCESTVNAATWLVRGRGADGDSGTGQGLARLDQFSRNTDRLRSVPRDIISRPGSIPEVEEQVSERAPANERLRFMALEK